MRSEQSLAKNLEAILRNHPVITTQAALARAAKISQSTVHRVLFADGKVSLDTLDKIAAALHVKPVELLRHDVSVRQLLEATQETPLKTTSKSSRIIQQTELAPVKKALLPMLVKPPSLLKQRVDVKQSSFRHLFWSTQKYTTVQNIINVVLTNPTFELVARCVKYFGINNVRHEIEARNDQLNDDVRSTLALWLTRIEKGAALAAQDKARV